MRLSRTLSAPSIGALLLLASAQSCATVTSTEELVRSSITGEGAPDWIGGSIVQIPGSVTFVGRGGGINVLDERHAFDEALGHARAQLAQYVATEVHAEACLRDYSSGARFLSFDRHHQGDGETVDQWIRSRVHEIADTVVGGVAASDQYWEQWLLSNDKPTGFLTYRVEGTHSFRRYKCWVLAHVDQSLIDTYVKASLASLERAADIAAAEAENAEAMAAAEAANSGLQAQVAASQGDFALAVNTLNAQSWELQRLRERVHYGRRFRLLSEEDCLHRRPACDFDRLHPEWMAPEYLVNTQVQTQVKHVSAPCSFCSDSPCSH
jgi:hypothetical protein